MHVVPLSSPRLPRVSEVPPSVALDAIARNLRPVYASLLDQSVPEHLAALSRRQYADARKSLSNHPLVRNAPLRTTPLALLTLLALLAFGATLGWAFRRGGSDATGGECGEPHAGRE